MSSQSESAELRPERFSVAVYVSGLGGWGALTVSPGALVVETSSLMQRFGAIGRLVHTDPDLVIVTARLIPPNMNVSVWIHDDEAWAQVMTWIGGRRRLSTSLRRSGFAVREAKTWLSRGSSRGVMGF
jgi:hypothetical protein